MNYQERIYSVLTETQQEDAKSTKLTKKGEWTGIPPSLYPLRRTKRVSIGASAEKRKAPVAQFDARQVSRNAAAKARRETAREDQETTHYQERIYTTLTENQNSTDSRLKPGHSKRMRDHEARIQRELLKPENQDDQSHSKETKEKASKVAKAREDAKRRDKKVSEGDINEVGDTAKGRERIRQALHNRKVDLEIAKSVQKDNPIGSAGQSPHQLAKLVRGASQGAKVSAYLKGRAKGGHKGAMTAFRAVKKKHVKDTAATERKYGGVPSVDNTGQPAGAGVRSATRNMVYRNQQIRRQVGEMAGAKGNPSASKGISTPSKRPSGYGQTERPSDDRIQALKDRVSAHFKANPDAEGAESHKEKGSTWKERPRKKSEK